MASPKSPGKFDAFIDNQYRTFDKRTKLLIVVFSLIIPAVLCYFLLFKPSLDEIDTLNKQIVTEQKSLKNARKRARNKPKHEQELEEVKKLFAQKSAMLPKQQEIPDLLRNISDLGKSAGLDFLKFAPAREIPRDFYAEIPVNISISGPYHNLGFFLDQVSKLERIVTVNNIRLGSPREEETEMLLNSDCQLLTYRFTNKKLPSEEKKKKK
ncbi:MAG: pilus assembly protein PilO [Desulfobulbus propionicus]|nr:MAG: pilus assembly protein PilO [Desulfobulbus propionicus]